MLLGISRGQGIGVPNLLGVQHKEPEQVRNSDTSSTQTPKNPTLRASSRFGVWDLGLEI